MQASYDDLINVIRDLTEDCVTTCADEGSTCHFCGAELEQTGLYTTRINHPTNCPYRRAKEIINSV